MVRPESAASVISWADLYWQKVLEADRVTALLRQWAADGRSPRLVVETRARAGAVNYHLGGSPAALRRAAALIPQVLPGAYVSPSTDLRQLVGSAAELQASTRHRPLKIDSPLPITRAVLAALTRARAGEELVVQIVLGPRRVPLAIPTNSPSSLTAPVLDIVWHGNGGGLDSDKRSALRLKVSDHGFACLVRLGVRAATPERRRSLLEALLAAIRTSEAPGVRLGLVHSPARRLDLAAGPWLPSLALLWPLRLNVQELAGLLAWPLGDDLPGQPAAHPKRLPPLPAVLVAAQGGKAVTARVVAQADAPGISGQLALPIRSALHHLHVLGPTGVGKSTLLARLALQDIQSGHGVVIIEPKGDLVEDILRRLPTSRRDDVVLLDPMDAAPVGLNPLSPHRSGLDIRSDSAGADLAADGLLSLFKQLYGSSIGPRSADILYAGLLTLARRSDASLVMLPLLLTNPGFRRSLVAAVGQQDPVVLGPFWAGFNAWSEGERAAAVAPVMNKLRPLLRPQLRAVLGQRRPRFDMSQVFTQRKILLVPLRRGVLGPEAAMLLGSLIVAQLWQATLARTAVPAERRAPVMVYIDEVQDYLRLPTDIGEALAQARGLGVGFTLAHQYLGQLPPELRAGITANARSRICFQLGADDAHVMSRGHLELEPADLTALGGYEIYASLFAAGAVTPYASGRTTALPAGSGDSDVAAVRSRSRAAYGRPLTEVEADFVELLNRPSRGNDPSGTTATDAPLGRRRRSA